MQSDDVLIEKTKRLFEENTGWGDSSEWTNQDFVILSDKIQERTGVALSHVTLKRVWGKVKYESLPNTHTLDTLVQFLGFQNWREFKCKNGNGGTPKPPAEPVIDNIQNTYQGRPVAGKKNKAIFKPVLIAASVITIALLFLYARKSGPPVIKSDYTFSSKKVVSEGLPNSVIFNYDATKAPGDSVIIQQSWDSHKQAKVSKYKHQYISIYYLPDYYKAKLIVGGKIVSMHRLLIKSKGWLPVVMQTPVPVYFSKEDVMNGGKMGLPADKILSRNIKMQPEPPTIIYSNVKDFGEIYSDNFTFETSVKNDYREGSAICQLTKIFILCEGTAVGIPLCNKGCIANTDLIFTNYTVSGKQADLSPFGVDFNSFVKVKIETKNRKADIFINDKLVYQVTHDIIKAKIIGFDFSFQGTGSVDYVKLSNGKVNYEDDF